MQSKTTALMNHLKLKAVISHLHASNVLWSLLPPRGIIPGGEYQAATRMAGRACANGGQTQDEIAHKEKDKRFFTSVPQAITPTALRS
jgi:hypothetical protein